MSIILKSFLLIDLIFFSLSNSYCISSGLSLWTWGWVWVHPHGPTRLSRAWASWWGYHASCYWKLREGDQESLHDPHLLLEARMREVQEDEAGVWKSSNGDEQRKHSNTNHLCRHQLRLAILIRPHSITRLRRRKQLFTSSSTVADITKYVFFWSRIPRIPKNFLESHVKKLGIPKHVFCWNPRFFFGVFFGIPQNPRNFCFLFSNPGGLQVESQLATHAFFSES